MYLSDVSTREIRRILKAVVRTVGADSTEAAILRRELARREQSTRRKRRKKGMQA